jgi:hypothetical protein
MSRLVLSEKGDAFSAFETQKGVMRFNYSFILNLIQNLTRATLGSEAASLAPYANLIASRSC